MILHIDIDRYMIKGVNGVTFLTPLVFPVVAQEMYRDKVEEYRYFDSKRVMLELVSRGCI